MTRRRIVLLSFLALFAIGADIRCDPSLSCSSSSPPPPPDTSFTPCDDDGCFIWQIAAGGQHTCFSIFTDAEPVRGEVVCWGRNDGYQLGVAGGEDVYTPQRTPFGDVARAPNDIAAGVLQSCALSDSLYACWGTNHAGLLGVGDVDSRFNGFSWLGEIQPLNLTLGSAHGCAGLNDGGIACWGDHHFGQLSPTYEGEFSAVPQVWAETDLVNLVAADAGGVMTCAASFEDSIVHCWGREHPSDASAREGNWEIALPTTISELSAGATHACAIDADRAVWCWGGGDRGQLGDGTIGGRSDVAVRVELPDLAWHVSAGGWIPATSTSRFEIEYGEPLGGHTCASLMNGETYCWGANDRGQLGDGTTIDRASPVRAQIERGSDIEAGGEHTCSTPGSVRVTCWGDNTRGQLGVDPDELSLSTSPRQLTW